MLAAYLIIDKTKFPLFEYFLDRSKAEYILEALEPLEVANGVVETPEYHFFLHAFSDRFWVCVAYIDEVVNDQLQANIGAIAKNIMNGDKISLQQVLNATSLQDFLAVK